MESCAPSGFLDLYHNTTERHMDSNENINDLLGRPIWQMTGKEYCELMQYAFSHGVTPKMVSHQQVTGIAALAKELSCSPSRLYEIQRNGNLRSAITSRIGRTPSYDVEKARLIADDYMAQKRAERAKTKVSQ